MNAGTARAAILGGLLGAAGWLIFAAGFVAGIAVVVVRAAHGTASVGAVVLAVTLIQRAQLQVGQAAAAIGQLLTTARTARRLLWLEDYAAADRAAGRRARPAERPRRAGARSATLQPSGITLREVSFGYPPDGATVLDRIDLHLPAARPSPWSARTGPARPRWSSCSPACTSQPRARCCWTACRSPNLDLAAWRQRTAAAFQDFVRYELLAGETVGIGDLPRLDRRFPR